MPKPKPWAEAVTGAAPTDAGSPWHAGERAAQMRAGTAAHMEEIGPRLLRDFMPDQHRAFFAQLPFLAVGSREADGALWASILSGPPGFVSSPHPQRLEVAARPVAGDPLGAALRIGAPLGILGIELPTRRRNRVNGHVIAHDEDGFAIAVDQSFGNCPQYIQRRDYAAFAPAAVTPAGVTPTGVTPAGVTVEPLATLDGRAADLIRAADTAFVASAAPVAGSDFAVDVSHRGGRPGFLGIAADGAIVVPDFRGNGFFQTLGNLTAYPHAGLSLVDFAAGDLLQLTGEAEILWDGPEVAAYSGAERLWKIRRPRGRWLRSAFPPRFGPAELSPRSRAVGVFPG